MTPYAERLLPRGRAWALAPGLGLLTVLSALPLGTVGAVAAGIGVTGVVAAMLVVSSPRLQVTPQGFRAGRAFLGAAHVGRVEVLTRAELGHGMGPGLRADAYVLHRSWVRGAVRVQVRDDADPTPYWLICSHRPAALAHALGAGAAGNRDLPGRDNREDHPDQAAHSEHTG